MWRLPDSKIQITGLRSARAVLAFAADAHAGSFTDAGRNPHVNRASLSVVCHRQASHRAVVCVFEIQLQLVLHVPALPRRPPARAAASLASSRAGLTSKKCMKEIGEWIRVAEHL